MEECVVCYENRLYFVSLGICGHSVCHVCFPKILPTRKCPLCRAELSSDALELPPPPQRRNPVYRRDVRFNYAPLIEPLPARPTCLYFIVGFTLMISITGLILGILALKL